MKREVCPNCGGTLVDESLGWRCKSCRGFISLQDGKFYEYVEKPFMPPQTNADRIRSLSDEELARWVGLDSCPKDAVCTLPVNCEKCWLDWLRQPSKDGENE